MCCACLASERLSCCRDDGRPSGQAGAFGGGVSGVGEGPGKREGGRGKGSARTGTASAVGDPIGTGSAGASVASAPPVMWLQKHAPSAGSGDWPCPACCSCAASCRHSAIARRVNPPGLAASQKPATATTQKRGVRRIGGESTTRHAAGARRWRKAGDAGESKRKRAGSLIASRLAWRSETGCAETSHVAPKLLTGSIPVNSEVRRCWRRDSNPEGLSPRDV